MSKRNEAALAALHNYYPDAATRLSEKIAGLNKENKVFDGWREEQLHKFIYVLKINAEELERGFTEKKAATTAWAARNILELDVWIEYCNLSDSHAKRFKDDSMRDLIGAFNIIISMVTELNGKKEAAWDQAQQAVEKGGQSLGIADTKYLQVHDAAEELGRRNKFTLVNRIYSKFAHPTAWVVDSALGAVSSEDICEAFFASGVISATQTLTKIHEHLEQRIEAQAVKVGSS